MISVIYLGLERVPQERTRYLSRGGFEKVPHGADWGIWTGSHLNKNAAGCGWGISIGIDLNKCHRVWMDWKVDSSDGGTEKDVKIFREGIQNIATGVRETKKGCGQHIWTRFQKIAIGNRGTKRVGSRQWDKGSKKCCRCKGTKEGCGWYIRTKDSKEQGTWISVTCHSRAAPGPKCCMPG